MNFKSARDVGGQSGRRREAQPNEALTWPTERQPSLLRATVARFEYTFREYLVL